MNILWTVASGRECVWSLLVTETCGQVSLLCQVVPMEVGIAWFGLCIAC